MYVVLLILYFPFKKNTVSNFTGIIIACSICAESVVASIDERSSRARLNQIV